MSPSEFQLRDALRDGEGDSIDPDRIIFRAGQQRRERRVRLLSVAAGVIVVGGVVTGGAVVMGNSDRGSSARSQTEARGALDGSAGGAAASAPPSPAAEPHGLASAPAAGVPGSVGSASVQAVRCPSGVPAAKLPGAGGRQLGGAGTLFDAAVTAVRICGYPAGSAKPQDSLDLYGSEARTLVASLEATPTQLSHGPCAADAASGTLYIVGVTAAGRTLTPVVVDLGCNGTISNGTVVRHGWTPPPRIAALTDRIPPGKSLAPGIPKNGSPAH